MAVDEAGEDVVGGEVEDLRPGGRDEAGGLDRLDALVGDDEGDVVGVMAGGGVEEMAGADVGGGRRLLGGGDAGVLSSRTARMDRIEKLRDGAGCFHLMTSLRSRVRCCILGVR